MTSVVQVFCSSFAWWLQSGEQVLHWLIISNLIDNGDTHSFWSQHIMYSMIYQWFGCLYLLQEAVLLENPLLSDISAILELSIKLVINPLPCALDWFQPLYAFLNSFRPRQDSRPEQKSIHVHFISPADLPGLFWQLETGVTRVKHWITLTKKNKTWKVTVVMLCWGSAQTSGLWGWINFLLFFKKAYLYKQDTLVN